MKQTILLLALVTTLHAEDAVRIEKNIAYLPAERKEKADLYLPADDGKKHPGVLIIHGGGWTGGKRDAARGDQHRHDVRHAWLRLDARM